MKASSTPNFYSSPFMRTEYSVGGKLKQGLYDENAMNDIIARNKDNLKIENFAFHTFRNKKTDMDYARSLLTWKFNPGHYIANYAVLKCRIPQNAAYVFKGKFNSIFNGREVDSLASSELEILKEIYDAERNA